MPSIPEWLIAMENRRSTGPSPTASPGETIMFSFVQVTRGFFDDPL
jgi:hypothetical protein